MPEEKPITQRYEYRAVDIEEREISLNEIASEGWRLVETIETNGTTRKLVFEKPVGPGVGVNEP